MIRNLVLLSTLFISGFCIAQQAENQDSSQMLTPLEVLSVRVNNKAPFVHTNLSLAQIKKLNQGQDVPFILNNTPSVVVSSDAGNGIGYTGIRIRGSDASRINVTLNGIPCNDAESQGAFFIDLPDLTSSVNSIQLQRGVGTSTNGAGAFGATISLSTNENNILPYLELNNNYGSFNSWKNTLKLGTGLIDNRFSTDVRLSRISSDGYIDRATTDAYSAFISSAFKGKKFDMRANIFSGKEKTYQAWNGLPGSLLENKRRYNSSGTAKPGNPYENETDNYVQTHYQLIYNQEITKAWKINFSNFLTRGKGYYELYRADAAYASYGLSDFIISNDTISSTDMVIQKWLDNYYYGQLLNVFYKQTGHEVTIGGGWTQYDGKHYGKVVWAKNNVDNGYQYYLLDAVKKDRNVFAKWQKDIGGHIYVFADLQYRNVDYTMNGFEQNPQLIINRKFNFLNPKLGLSYIANGWNAFVSYAKASKEPNRSDFEAALTNQPKAEGLNDFEAGIEKRNKHLFASVGLYYMGYKNQLVQTGQINDVGAYTRINVSNSYRAGIELQLGYAFNKAINLQTNLTLSRNKIKEFVQFYDNYDVSWKWLDQKNQVYQNPDIAFSPSVIGGYTISIKPIANCEIAAIGKYVGTQHLDNTSDKSRMLNAYYTQDLRLIYSFGKNKSSNLFLQLNNLFNKLYEPNGYTYSYYLDNKIINDNYYYPMAGFYFMTGLNLRF